MILRDITDGLKHIELTKKPHKQVSDQGRTSGTIDYTFQFTFEQPMLYVTLIDGRQVYMHETIKKVFEYTEQYFASKLDLSQPK
jgi:hypothetical protein